MITSLSSECVRIMHTCSDMIVRKKSVLILITALILCVLYLRTKDFEKFDGMQATLDRLRLELEDSQSLVKQLSQVQLDKRSTCAQWDPALPVVYVITPTFARPVQKAELTRLSQTFMLVQNLHWIIVEDSKQKTALVSNLLKNSNLNYTHLINMTPPQWKLKQKEQRWRKPRGVTQRNAGLTWLRESKKPAVDRGVVYFADDDNTYTVQILNEMRYTRKASVWPVGLVGGLMVEKPNIDPDTGRVSSWNSAWRPERKFPIDMAGFAINLRILLEKPSVKFSYQVERGYLETDILSQVTTPEELEPLADNCTKVLVWHTRSQNPNLEAENRLARKSLPPSNAGIEV
ncbi:unnamed protein product [Bemisia tabaci]|uniref:Galactosylgalactosylxylosylprotein 3-beta-glucuronosyltransferase n=1 Tax=Bemisia tabaci TaxID=7038 RepID=A0A9P0F307_BEMTA|nr:unnamed protein product [Bemisia tabaci]